MEAIVGIKPASDDHESNSKKVGSIPFGFNTMGTIRIKKVQIQELFNTSILLLIKDICTFPLEIVKQFINNYLIVNYVIIKLKYIRGR